MEEISRNLKVFMLIVLSYYAVVIMYLLGAWALVIWTLLILVGMLFIDHKPKKKRKKGK